MIERHFGKFLLLFLVLKAHFECISMRELELGPCYLSILEPCANNSIQFYLFNGDTPDESPILLDNISPELPFDFSNETNTRHFKMIIHGYGGHIDVNGSKQIREGRKRDAKKAAAQIQVQICVANSFYNFFMHQNLHLPHIAKLLFLTLWFFSQCSLAFSLFLHLSK
jgi:hypothetical protein